MADQRTNPETGYPERECEDCIKWMPLSEFPTKGRTWLCKVCQGMKAPPKQKANGKDVGYAAYLEALKKVKEEKAAYKAEVRLKLIEFDQRLARIVAEQYTKYGKEQS